MSAQRWLMLGCASVLSGLLTAELQAGESGGAAGGKPAKAATANSATPEQSPPKKKGKTIEGPEGLRFSLTSESVAKIYDKQFDADFLPRYRKVQPGPAMAALDQELEDRKGELRRVLEFNDTPVALENTPLKNEFTYENNESMNHVVLSRVLMNDDLQGERSVEYHRYFFYFGDKLWKIYDEYKLSNKKGLAGSFDQGVQQLSKQLGSKPQMLKPDSKAWRDYPAAQWTVGDTVVQLLDRHDENRLAVLYMQKSTLDNLSQLRSHKPEVETVSSEVSTATSKSSKPKKDGSSPADAYTRKKRPQSSEE